MTDTQLIVYTIIIFLIGVLAGVWKVHDWFFNEFDYPGNGRDANVDRILTNGHAYILEREKGCIMLTRMYYCENEYPMFGPTNVERYRLHAIGILKGVPFGKPFLMCHGKPVLIAKE